jgi:hypothetical protein
MFVAIAISNLSCCIRANAVTVDLVCVLLFAYLVIRVIGVVVYTTSDLASSSMVVNILRHSLIVFVTSLLDSVY